MAWTLARIKTKARRLTGRLDSNAFSDSTLLAYINDYYTETLISELNLPELESWYEFNTTLNDEDYALSSDDYIVGTPVYINGVEANYYNDPKQFYSDYQQTYSEEILGTGDGSTTNFTYTLNSTPVKGGTTVIDDTVEVFTASSGTLTGDQGGSGTVNVTTGAVTVNFNTAPTSGQLIKVRYEYFNTGIPTSVLFYNNTLYLRPVPNGVYRVKVSNSTVPTAFSADSDTPTQDDWGSLIAYGAALDILRDYEGEGALITQRVKVGYTERLDNINTRLLRQFKDKVANRSF